MCDIDWYIYVYLGNEKYYINSAPIESLKIIGLNNTQRDLIWNKRKQQLLGSADDLRDLLGVEHFKKLKADCLERIVYSYEPWTNLIKWDLKR